MRPHRTPHAAGAGRAGRPRGRAVVVAAIGSGALLLASCGLPQDDEPRVIARDALPKVLNEAAGTTTVPPLGVRATARTLYLVHTQGSEDRLEAIAVQLEDPNDPADLARSVIERLVNTPVSPDDPELTSAIPAGVRVLRATPDGEVLDIDLSNLGNIESTRQRLAVAQIVFTATALDGVGGVRFSIDGAPSAVPIDEGTAEAGRVLTRDDFPSLRNALATAEAEATAREDEPPATTVGTTPPVSRSGG